jgi:prepilin-type processing-associated H-X9-DG protein
MAAPSLVLNPLEPYQAGEPAVPGVCCSYGMNADNTYCQNGPVSVAGLGSIGTLPVSQRYAAEPCSIVGSEYLPPRKMNMIKKPADLCFIYDGASGQPPGSNLFFRIANRHGSPKLDSYTNMLTSGMVNVLFFDGHVETLPRKQLPWYSDGNNTHSLGQNMGYSNYWNPASLGLYQQQAALGGFQWPFWRVDQ